MSGQCVRKSESFNSVDESQKCDSEALRPKTLATMNMTEGEAARSPGNGSLPVTLLCCLVLCVGPLHFIAR